MEQAEAWMRSMKVSRGGWIRMVRKSERMNLDRDLVPIKPQAIALLVGFVSRIRALMASA